MPTSATRRATRIERPRLALSVQVAPGAGAVPADRAQLRRWLLATLSTDASITLRLVGSREGRALNAAYRGRDHATNVLTFAYDEGLPPGSPVHADIVICLPVVVREARAQRKAVRDHLAHLVVHGALHAQGLDHEDDEQARAMQARETEVLARFRIADPYR